MILSFESGEDTYKALKTALDGGLSQRCDNVLVYATSNRRHLMPEYMDENQATTGIRGEVQPKEAVEEKVSLSDRFGLWLSFTRLIKTIICKRWKTGSPISAYRWTTPPATPRSIGR